MIVIDLASSNIHFVTKLNKPSTANYVLELTGEGSNILYTYEFDNTTFSNNRYDIVDIPFEDEKNNKVIQSSGFYEFSIKDSDTNIVLKNGLATIINSDDTDEVREIEPDEDEDDVRSADDILFDE